MGSAPADSDSTWDKLPHQPRLPSFNAFLSGVGRQDVRFSSGPVPYRKGSRSVVGPGQTNDAPWGHDPRQLNIPAFSNQNEPHLSDPASHSPERHHPPEPCYFLPQISSNLPKRLQPLPSCLTQGPLLDGDSSRVVVDGGTVPGRRVCYIYDGGGGCRKFINDNAINPQWGTTKAGKPRKRLAQACDSCREKKVKCDAGGPPCVQCQKIGRKCTFQPATSATQKPLSSLSSAPFSLSTEQALEKPSPARSSTVFADTVADEVPHETLRPNLSVSLSSPLGLQFVDEVATEKGQKSENALGPALEGRPLNLVETELPTDPRSPLSAIHSFAWQIDPYELDSDLTLYYITEFFSHIDRTVSCILAFRPFMCWVKTCTAKSLADKMLLYAILAMGSALAQRPERNNLRMLFLDIVNEAVLKSGDSFSLQLVHTRLILALLAFSQGQYNQAWVYCGCAMRTAFGLKLNTEEGIRTIGDGDEMTFGFDQATLIECRRRTFWSAYIIDCFNGCFSTPVIPMDRPNCLLQLPCAQEAYEEGVIPTTRFGLDALSVGDNGDSILCDSTSQVGLLGYLAEVTIIFNDIVANINRSRHLSPSKCHINLETFYRDIMSRLLLWDGLVKKNLRKSKDSENRSESASGLYIFYHYTAMLLHRHVRHAELEPQSAFVHVTEAYSHAQTLLKTVQQTRNDEDNRPPLTGFAATSPFLGFAITAALDVITAAGTLSDLIDRESLMMSLISTGLEALETLSEYWASAEQQRDLICQRLSILLAATRKASVYNGAFYFSRPIRNLFGLEQDIVYGLPRTRYFEALGWDHKTYGGYFHRLDREEPGEGRN